MSGSAFQLLMAQGWLSVWTTFITIISVFFFTYIESGRTQSIDWSVANFMVGFSAALVVTCLLRKACINIAPRSHPHQWCPV